MHQFTSKYKKIAENERNAQNQGKSGILAHISKIGHKPIYNKHHPCALRMYFRAVAAQNQTYSIYNKHHPCALRLYFRAVAAENETYALYNKHHPCENKQDTVQNMSHFIIQ